jgi:hypothetical protein
MNAALSLLERRAEKQPFLDNKNHFMTEKPYDLDSHSE